jgi:hypothetical protein
VKDLLGIGGLDERKVGRSRLVQERDSLITQLLPTPLQTELPSS